MKFSQLDLTRPFIFSLFPEDRKLYDGVVGDELYNVTFNYYVPMLCSDFDRDSLLDFSFSVYGQKIVYYDDPPVARRELEYDIEEHCLLGNMTLPIDVPQFPRPTCLPELKGEDLECSTDNGIYVDSANVTYVHWNGVGREVFVTETNITENNVAYWYDSCRGNDDTVIADLEVVLFVPELFDPYNINLFIATDGGNAETGTCAIGKLDSDSGKLYLFIRSMITVGT